jgi:hypothetical protein
VAAPQGLRGGSWNNNANNLQSSNRNNNPTNENNNIGFRVATVPEPGTALLAQVTLLRGILAFFRAWIARKSKRVGDRCLKTRCSEDLLA